LIDSGNLLVIGELRHADLQARADAAAKKLAEAAAAEEAARKEIAAQLASRPDDFLAVILPNNKKAAACTIKTRKAEGASWSAGGYATLADFAKASRVDSDWRFDELSDDLEKLWALVQKGGCSGLILTGSEASALLPALDREKLRYQLLPLRTHSELHEAYASKRGYASVAQLNLAAELKANASQVKALAEFKITDLAGHRAASARMQGSGYSKSTDLEDLLSFLADEAEGAKNKRSALQVRAARSAAEEARARERAERLRREMPLYSVQLICMEPMGHLAETMMGHLANSPAAFIQIMSSGNVSKFCQQMALPVSNPDVISQARMISRDSAGAEYYVSKAPDGRSMLGLIKRRGG
jgi:hypothetical protein